MELEQGKNVDFWRDMTTITEDEISKLRKLEASGKGPGIWSILTYHHHETVTSHWGLSFVPLYMRTCVGSYFQASLWWLQQELYLTTRLFLLFFLKTKTKKNNCNLIETSGDRREGINTAVSTDVQSVFKGKTYSQLQALYMKIESQIREGGSNLDISYWESLLQQVRVYMARARCIYTGTHLKHRG